jgi:hypothetical protein
LFAHGHCYVSVYARVAILPLGGIAWSINSASSFDTP